jgi:hypothetical protein
MLELLRTLVYNQDVVGKHKGKKILGVIKDLVICAAILIITQLLELILILI